MTTSLFFEERTEHSRTKAAIVGEYFRQWSAVLASNARRRGDCLQYIDLFAGPGVYEDGEESTPVLIVKTALERGLHDILHCRFNDADPVAAASLEKVLRAIPDVSRMRYPPQVYSSSVDQQVTELIERTHLPPTLSFLDPFGYKGLSNRLIQACLKDFGCECIFFFNYKRVNAGIQNDTVAEHIEALFEVSDVAALRGRLVGLPPRAREAAVMGLLDETLKKRGHAQYVRHFTFVNDAGTRTMHRIVFATNNPLGAKIMKAVMAKASSWEERGVPSYTCGRTPEHILTPGLFDNLERPLAELEEMVLKTFAGRVVKAGEVHMGHGLDLAYTEQNYKTLLKRLEHEGRVRCNPPAERRKANTMKDETLVEFPPLPT
jgi:three-Cys-motif partner protein